MKTRETGSRIAPVGLLAALLVLGIPFFFGSGSQRGSPLATDLLAASWTQARFAFTTTGPADAPWVIPQDAGELANPVPRTEEAIARGGQIYQRMCASCHGRGGQNDGPGARMIDAMSLARALTDATLQEEPDGVLFWKITEGSESMPATKNRVGEEERWAIVHYLRALGDGR